MSRLANTTNMIIKSEILVKNNTYVSYFRRRKYLRISYTDRHATQILFQKWEIGKL